MSRFKDRFESLRKKGEGAYVPFFVLGDPINPENLLDRQRSIDTLKATIDAGADALELGFWFSDPIADGPAVQAADKRARDATMTVDQAFDIIGAVRQYDSDIPIGMLVYYQLVHARNSSGGNFCLSAASAGADAILMPNLPVKYLDQGIETVDFAGLDQVYLVAPQSSDETLEMVASRAEGFIYQVARKGTTGATEELSENTLELVKRTKSFTAKHNDTPVVVGFGISKPDHIRAVLDAGADGAITGSALCKIIETNLRESTPILLSEVSSYVKSCKEATY